MSNYTLMPTESFIINYDSVMNGNTRGELVLTNQNLVFVTSKGVFKTTYIPQRYPVSQIKMFNGKAQVILGKAGNMDVHFVNGQETFKFVNNDALFSEKKAEKEAERWANAINQLLTGENLDVGTSADTAAIGTEMVTGALKGTIGAVKDAFGIKQNPQNQNVESSKNSSNKCKFCGAPISGSAGQKVRCRYCDADQQI